MKSRKGFVSNSSSSSFVVAFKTLPESAEELQKVLFGADEIYSDPWDDCSWSAQEIAKIVFQDFEGQKPLSPEEVLKAIKAGWFPGYPDDRNSWGGYWRLKGEEFKKAQEAHYKKVDEKALEVSNNFLTANKDCQFFEFEYSDNDGNRSSAMEHGDLFHRIPHLRISKH
jgi:hypothetical protein